MFEKETYNYMIFVNHSGIPEIPETVELLGFKGDVELSIPDELDRHKGQVLVVRGPVEDMHHWLAGVTLYMSDDAHCQSWSKYTMPDRKKH